MNKTNTLIVYLLIVLPFVNVSSLNAMEITIEYADGSSEIREYQEFEERLVFYKASIIDIRNLENLERIDRLVFTHMPENAEWEFLSKLENVNELVMNFVTLDTLDFLGSMQNLEVCIIQASKVLTENIDLLGSTIRYLEMTQCRLEKMPEFFNVPVTLEMINLGMNSIQYVDIDSVAQHPDTVFSFIENPIEDDPNLNNVILGEGYFDWLPDEYRHYMM